MAAFVASSSAGGTGVITSLRTGNIAVSGTNLCLVVGAGNSNTTNPAHTFAWDPDGNNEAMTGSFGELAAGSYLDGECEYLDDPTTATAPVEVSWTGGLDETIVFGLCASAAGNIVGTDVATSTFAATGTSLSATAPNVTTNDLTVGFSVISNLQAVTVGGSETARETNIDSGSYLRGTVSTRPDNGAISHTFSTVNYGGLIWAMRIPDSGGGPAANPKGPLGMPLHGPFAGPIGP